jgi:uncharacterized LabA/DUF88 family protein
MAAPHPRIAILIDGGFFLKRLPKVVPAHRCDTPERIVASLRYMCRQHVMRLAGVDRPDWLRHIHRIFYYDAHPFEEKRRHPMTNEDLNYANSDRAIERRQLFALLRKQRKAALRLGKVSASKEWTIPPRRTKKLLRTKQRISALDRLPTAEEVAHLDTDTSLTLSPDEVRDLVEMRDAWHALQPHEVKPDFRQKGVDMRIGIDAAHLTDKALVDTIILVAGDSDFVPAAKHARRNGIDFILDPLWQRVNEDLFEHIDGLQSGFPNPQHHATSGDTDSGLQDNS